MRCRSENFGYQRCAADTRRGVELARQISSTACVEGRNWGTERNAIWVDRGCDAEFRIGHRHGGIGGGTLRCRSEAYRYQHCPADIRAGVRLVQQRSQAPCQRGRSWGTDRNGIWVDRGCDAEFQVGHNRR
jgi:hypothetical protein